MATKYGMIGKTYISIRAVGLRIKEKLLDLLDLPENPSIVDIEADSGKCGYDQAEQKFMIIALNLG
jgi:hypothetical protein